MSCEHAAPAYAEELSQDQHSNCFDSRVRSSLINRVKVFFFVAFAYHNVTRYDLIPLTVGPLYGSVRRHYE